MQPMNGQSLVHSFGRTARGTRIEMHEFAMQSVQRLFGRRIVLARKPHSAFGQRLACPRR